MRRAWLGIGAGLLLLLALVALGRGRSGEPAAAQPGAGSASGRQAQARRFWEEYRAATRYRMEGRLREAVGAYTAALAINGSHEDALYYLGNVQLELGRHADAERAWQRLVAVNPRSERGYSRLGELRLCVSGKGLRDLGRAEAAFRQAQRINQEQIGALLRLGQVALLREKRAEAARYFREVLGTHASSGPAHYYLGYLAWKSGDAGAAETHFDRAIKAPTAVALAGHASAEGDVKNGPPPGSVEDPTCPPFEAPLAALRAAARRPPMEESYRAIDGVLAGLRRDRP